MDILERIGVEYAGMPCVTCMAVVYRAGVVLLSNLGSRALLWLVWCTCNFEGLEANIVDFISRMTPQSLQLMAWYNVLCSSRRRDVWTSKAFVFRLSG